MDLSRVMFKTVFIIICLINQFPRTLSEDSSEHCLPGWTEDTTMGYCRIFVAGRRTYTDAVQICEDRNSSIYQFYRQGGVLPPLPTYRLIKYWAKVMNTNNMRERASNMQGKCAAIGRIREFTHRDDENMLEYENCERKFEVLCEMPLKYADDYTCSRFSRRIGFSCYWTIQNLMTRYMAVRGCTFLGGHLARVRNKIEIDTDEFMAVTSNHTGLFWVGDTEEDHWNCTRMNYSESGFPLEMSPEPCLMKAYPLCQMAPTKTTPRPPRLTSRSTASTPFTTSPSPPTLATRVAPLYCPVQHIWRSERNGSVCYWETTYEVQKMSWDEARAFCQKYGGDLVSYENAEVEKFALGHGFGHSWGIWIGLRRKPQSNNFEWSDGSPLTYTNWKQPDQPKLSSTNKQCVAHANATSAWEVSYCGTRRWFICEAPKEARSPHFHPSISSMIDDKKTKCQFPENDLNVDWWLHGENCYSVWLSSTFSWEMARQYCAGMGAFIASVHSYDQTDFLLGLIRGTSDDHFWIGLKLKGLGSSFAWSDGSLLDFVNWEEDEGNTTIQDNLNIDSCISFHKLSGSWIPAHCNTFLPVICQKHLLEHGTVQPPKQKPKLLGGCPKDWYTFDNDCYKPFGHTTIDKETWEKANQRCLDVGAKLASVHSEPQQDFLTGLMLEVDYSVWIGMYSTIRGSLFHWTDETEIDYVNWKTFEPTNAGREEDCVEMVYDVQDMGKWNDVVCNKRKGFICQRPKDETLVDTTNNPRVCPERPGWIRLGSTCYSIVDNVVDTERWRRAQMVCEKDGGNLASIKNAGVAIFLKYLMAENDLEYWIGARDTPREINRFTWLSRYPLVYTDWMTGEPKMLSNNSNCVAINSQGLWMVRECNEKHPFICEHHMGSYPTVPPEDLRENCPNNTIGWMDLGRPNCYLFQIDSEETWNEATKKCFRKGGHLASFHYMEDLEAISVYTHKTDVPLHIGLGQKDDGSYGWIDGSPVDFLFWEDGEPNSDTEHCVEMHAKVLTWNDIDCDQLRGYICSAPKEVRFKNGLEELADTSDGERGKKRKGLPPGATVALVLTFAMILAAVVVFTGKIVKSIRAKRHATDDATDQLMVGLKDI